MDYLSRAFSLETETVNHRRYLHKYAECGLDMPMAKRYIVHQLSLCGIKAQPCGSGLSATLGSGSPVILLRADMDALPMEEHSGEAFSSVTDAAHTCGHDFHTAMLLTAAKLLKQNEKALKGTVKLMFQPAEETLEGCRNMTENGILENPAVDAALAFHVGAGRLPVGTVMYNAHSAMMLSADNFTIEIHGKGGHGAYPHLCVSPINIAVQIYNALQSIIALETDGQKSTVLTFGSIHSGENGNVIGSYAAMAGTLRCDDQYTRQKLKKRICETVCSISANFGGNAKVHWQSSAPALLCDADFTEKCIDFIGQLDIPSLNFIQGIKASASEDFAHIASKVPSAMIYLSAGFSQSSGEYTAHSPYVRFNEDVCPIGAACYAHCAHSWLEAQSKSHPQQH